MGADDTATRVRARMDEVEARLDEIDALDEKMLALYGRQRWFDRKGEPIPFSIYMELAFRDRDYKHVVRTKLRRVGRRRWTRCVVSTVWLGEDQNHRGVAGPILFESMVFGGPLNGFRLRWHTENDAGNGHDHVVYKVEKAIRDRLPARKVKPARAPARYKYKRTGRAHD